MKVVHAFKAYLPVTENWAYRLISGAREVEHYITTVNFLASNFYNNNFSFLRYPLSQFPNPSGNYKLALANRAVRMAEKIYSRQQYLADQCKKEKVDMLHSHFAFVGWEYHALAQRLNIPHVISFYGYDYENLPYNEPIWKERYQRLFKEAAAFVCEGTHGASVLKKMGCDPSKVHVVRLGVDTRVIPFFQREKKPKALKLLQIAAFREKKGHIHTLKAFEKALAKCPGLSLTLVGSGPLEKSLKKYVSENKLQNHVEFIDRIDFSQLHAFMRNYDVFIHPSCYSEDKDCEGGAPIVLLDAQATGMPVISTLHCDIPDEVIHDQTGLLANEKDTGQLSQHIETFYEMDQPRYEAFSLNARKHIEANYQNEVCSKSLQELYLQIGNAR